MLPFIGAEGAEGRRSGARRRRRPIQNPGDFARGWGGNGQEVGRRDARASMRPVAHGEDEGITAVMELHTRVNGGGCVRTKKGGRSAGGPTWRWRPEKERERGKAVAVRFKSNGPQRKGRSDRPEICTNLGRPN